MLWLISTNRYLHMNVAKDFGIISILVFVCSLSSISHSHKGALWLHACRSVWRAHWPKMQSQNPSAIVWLQRSFSFAFLKLYLHSYSDNSYSAKNIAIKLLIGQQGKSWPGYLLSVSGHPLATTVPPKHWTLPPKTKSLSDDIDVRWVARLFWLIPAVHSKIPLFISQL